MSDLKFQPTRQPWVLWYPKLVVFNVPQTTTVLALGFLVGLLLFTPMIALIGKNVPTDYREDVREIVKLIRDGMLLILGFYFAKVVNAGQQDMANKAIEAAERSAPTRQEGDPPRE